MRTFVLIPLISLLLATGCSGTDDRAREQQKANAAAAAAAKKAPGEEPATSPAALEAKKTVEQYFKFIDAGDYRSAYLLWGDSGADTRGTLEQFAATFAPYSVHKSTVGTPTEIKVSDGKQYILVTGTIDVKNRKTGGTAHREGVVMLRRSANPAEAAPDKKEWRIWGVDIRVHH